MSYLSQPASTSKYGVVEIGNGITVANGVISVTSGGGGATIGTWVPTLTSSLGAAITLTVSTANYAKMGQQVICYFDFVVATETGGGNNGTITLNGLPFTSISGSGIVGNLIVTYFALLDNSHTYITGTVANSSTQVLMWTVHQDASSTRMLQSDIRPTTRLVGTITYLSSNSLTLSPSSPSHS